MRSLTQLATRSLTLLALGACLASPLVGCAQEREPINRVQPNYYHKTYFTDDWVYQRTVVAVPASNGFTFVGDTDFWGVRHIRWDIQEGFLYGRRTTELVKNADDANRREAAGEEYEGEVVAAYRITKHFDIVRAYNSMTGEELNILEENSWDRPWYEREFIRVDWSVNLVTNADLSWEAASAEPVPYFVQEFDDATGLRHRDAPVFEPDATRPVEAGTERYFDVTNKMFARAGTINYPPYGDIPLCWLDETIECGAGEYTIRHSFWKRPADHQFEPLAYKGKMTEAYGYIWSERLVYDEAGLFEQNRERYANIHNLWQRSFDDDGDPLPYADRGLRPVVYYKNRDFPSQADDPTLNDAVKDVETMYASVFNDAVDALEVDRDGQSMFLLCNNPVVDTDPKQCGAAGLSPRLGDMR
jgi:hypothetical protein